MGLPAVDDPDAAVHLRADAEAAAFAQKFIELGIDPDQIVQITRMLAEGLSRAAEVMRYAALASVLDPTRDGAGQSPRIPRRWYARSLPCSGR